MIGLSIDVQGSSSDDPADKVTYNPAVSYTGIRVQIDTGIIWHKITCLNLIQYGMPEEVNRASFTHDKESLYLVRADQNAADRKFISAIITYAKGLGSPDRQYWIAKALEWQTAIEAWTQIRFSPLGLVISEAI